MLYVSLAGSGVGSWTPAAYDFGAFQTEKEKYSIV